MSILSRYQDELANKNLTPDPAQREAIVALDALSRKRPRANTVKAFTLWAVGRGKTMLMDWFYQSTPVTTETVALSSLYAAGAKGIKSN